MPYKRTRQDDFANWLTRWNDMPKDAFAFLENVDGEDLAQFQDPRRALPPGGDSEPV